MYRVICQELVAEISDLRSSAVHNVLLIIYYEGLVRFSPTGSSRYHQVTISDGVGIGQVLWSQGSA